MPDRTLVVIALTFVAIFAALQVVVWALALRGYFTPITSLTATVAGACARATGVAVTVTDSDIVLTSRILRIDPDCTGVTLILVYSALVLAYPLSIARRVSGLAFGIPVILVANLVRLVAVARLSGPLGDSAFRFAHDYLFEIAMIAVVIVLWAYYLASARRDAH